MEIKVETKNARVPIAAMSVSGAIDSDTYEEFQANADELITAGALYLLIDFANVSFISSAGLRVLHGIFNKLRALHKDVDDDELRKKMSLGEYKSPYLKVCNLSSQIREVFELSGFETYIEIYEDLSTAIASF